MRVQPVVVAALVALAADDASARSAATCARWANAQPPANTTLAADATNSNAAVLVTSACVEKPLSISTTFLTETALDVSTMGIVTVASLPRVNKLVATSNAIESFAATDASALSTLDLSNNGITSLDRFSFPSTLKSLDLSDNLIAASRASQFPRGLNELYLRKNQLTSLKLLDFPPDMKFLNLDGNALTTLNGAILPSALETLSCMDTTITTIEGVWFPSTLTKFAISNKAGAVTTFNIRASDLPTLDKIKASDLKTAIATCSNSDAKLTTTASGLTVCVLTDAAFDKLYPQRSTSTKTLPSSPLTPSATLPNGNGGGTAETAVADVPNTSPDTNANNSNSSNNSTTFLLVGILVLVAVVIGAVIGFVMQRRKRKPLRASDLRELLAEAAATASTDGKSSVPQQQSQSCQSRETKTGRSLTMGLDVTDPLALLPPPPFSANSGYLTNDVRTDDELRPYRLPREDVKIVRELATGGFGVVYLATFFDSWVVVKQIVPTKVHSTAILKRFMAEIRLFAKLEHPKIAQFIGLSWTTLFDLSLVMEFVPNGDLHDVLKQSRALDNGRDVFTWLDPASTPRAKSLIALDVAEALVYLHSFEPVIIHRDLKSKNILLDSDWTAKLADFGISREALGADASSIMTGGMGTTAWIAPEVLQGERYSEKADIYSFGIVLSELDTCGHPYNSNKPQHESLTDPKIAVLVSTDAIKPTIELDCPVPIRELILSCVAFDPAQRPSAMELHYKLRTIRSEWLESVGLRSKSGSGNGGFGFV